MNKICFLSFLNIKKQFSNQITLREKKLSTHQDNPEIPVKSSNTLINSYMHQEIQNKNYLDDKEHLNL